MLTSYKLIFQVVLISTSFSLYSCAGMLSRKVNDLPQDPLLITSDLDNFYSAFDRAVEDTANAESIFKQNYFRKGSKGLQDFYKLKIRSTEKFTDFVMGFSDYYESIRKDITDLSDLEQRILNNFGKFEEIFPPAKYPNVYFVVGNYTSNGTISKNGLLIGTEIMARTPASDTATWNKDILRISLERDHIPVTVSHELVHFNQGQMKKGNTLLWKSIREGSAEFIAELISGKTDADYSQFTGRELEIWIDFKTDMHKNIWSSWQQANEDRPRNAGYWVGYMICKAYQAQVKDDKQAVKDILNIQDYEEFYRESKVEEYIEAQFIVRN